MSADGEWEGAAAPGRRVGVLAAMVGLALVTGLLLGRGSGDGVPPSELIVQATERPPEPPPVSPSASPSPMPDPVVAGEWRTVRPSPLRGRSMASTAWTGSQLLVWGGAGHGVYADGALYDPVADRWQTVRKAPLRGRFGHASVWDGAEVVIAGGNAPSKQQDTLALAAVALRGAAAYNPAEDRWRRLPDLPFALSEGRLFASSGRIYAVARTARRRPVAVLDAGSAMWRLLPPAPDFGGDATAAGVTRNTLIIWPASPGDAVALDLRSQEWTRLGLRPRPDAAAGQTCSCTLVPGTYPTGAADLMAYDAADDGWWRHYVQPIRPSFAAGDNEWVYLLQTPYSAAALDRETGTVFRLPPPPQEPAVQPVTAFTGDALFLWSGVNPLKFRYPADGLLFTPTRASADGGPRRILVF